MSKNILRWNFRDIDESQFSVLYSDIASSPNVSENVIVGALIIKELFDYSDDEMDENLMVNLHLQLARIDYFYLH